MKLNAWRISRRLSYTALGRLLGIKPARNARRLCLPPDHPEYRRASDAVILDAYRISRGAVTPNDWYELPELPTAGTTITEARLPDREAAA